MGWHYILRFSCKLKPEYIEFVRHEYLRDLCDERDDPLYLPDGGDDGTAPWSGIASSRRGTVRQRAIEAAAAGEAERAAIYEGLSRDWRGLIDYWHATGIGAHFYEYDLTDDGVFTCEISKKVIWHRGDLKEAYLVFLRDVVVRISAVVLTCEIESDDFGDQRWHYTDSDLRNQPFCLQDKIRSIEHTYSEDGQEILESRVVYKHAVQAHEHRDLERAYWGNN